MSAGAGAAAGGTGAGARIDSPGRRALRKLMRRKAAVFGLCVVTLFVLVAVLAPWIAPYDPVKTSWTAIRKAPSALHWFGTDENGRDILSRIVHGASTPASATALPPASTRAPARTVVVPV